MQTPEQRRTLFNIGMILALLAAVAFAMTAPGCGSSSGGAQFDMGNIRQAAVNYVKSARLAVSVRKSNDGICLDFGIADSSGFVFIGTGAALVHVDAPCWSNDDVLKALGIGEPGPPAPAVLKVLPLHVNEIDTSGEAPPDVLIREDNDPVKGE